VAIRKCVTVHHGPNWLRARMVFVAISLRQLTRKTDVDRSICVAVYVAAYCISRGKSHENIPPRNVGTSGCGCPGVDQEGIKK